MLHGNPTWSFYYRNLVLALRDRYRCVVPDHIGCGLSDKPGDNSYDYTLGRRMDDLERLLDHLGITTGITLVLHDWGGMIGILYAVRHPMRIKRLVILNTAAFHLPKKKQLPFTLKLCRDTRLGAFLVRGFNAFSLAASFIGCKKNPMPSASAAGLSPPLRLMAKPHRNAPVRPGYSAHSRRPELSSGQRDRGGNQRFQRPTHRNLLGRAGLCLRSFVSLRMGAAISKSGDTPIRRCGALHS